MSSSAEFSCIFIHVRSPVRQAAIRTVQWPGFDALILVAIVVNCVFMALDPPYGWLVEATEVYLKAATPPASRRPARPRLRAC